jgi:hypothetical protein
MGDASIKTTQSPKLATESRVSKDGNPGTKPHAFWYQALDSKHSFWHVKFENGSSSLFKNLLHV